MRDPHIHVIHDHAKIVGGRAVGARNDQIVELGILKNDSSMHHVIDHDVARERILEAHHRRDAWALVRSIAPPAVVAWLLATGHLLGA